MCFVVTIIGARPCIASNSHKNDKTESSNLLISLEFIYRIEYTIYLFDQRKWKGSGTIIDRNKFWFVWFFFLFLSFVRSSSSFILLIFLLLYSFRFASNLSVSTIFSAHFFSFFFFNWSFTEWKRVKNFIINMLCVRFSVLYGKNPFPN